MGLSPLKRKVPLTGVEWADKYFYLPEGSSQIAGRWVTQPLQVAPLNMMCNDAIREVDWQKSARVGYTKLLVAATMYLSEHKKRNGLIFQPTKEDVEDFVLDEIDAAIAEVPVFQAVFPGWDSENKNNKRNKKKGIGFNLDIRGANSPRNFRAKTKQFIIGDELDAWPLEVGKEGDPVPLALKRLEGAAYPKAIFGTTPTIRNISHIQRRMEMADEVFRFHLPCPHCGHEQTLKWGGKDAEYGVDWDRKKHPKELTSKDVWYKCENSKCVDIHPAGKGRIYYSDLPKISEHGRWIADDSLIWTQDGIKFYSPAGTLVTTPKHVGLHINAIYSLTLTDGWVGLVRDWLGAQGDPLKLKAFINTTLGELWDDETGEKLDWEKLFAQREAYRARVPMKGLYLTMFWDTQDDRLEGMVVAWGRGQESYVVDYKIITGNTLLPDVWDKAEQFIRSAKYKHESGQVFKIRRWGIDSGGHRTDQVHSFVKRFSKDVAHPCRGSSKYGEPVVTRENKKNKRGTQICWIGTDTAKDIVYGRYNVMPEPDEHTGKMPRFSDPVPGMVHYPIAPFTTEAFFKQATAEVKRIVYVKGRKTYRYEPKKQGIRNEVLDCFVGNLAMVTLAEQNYGLDLDLMHQSLLASMAAPAERAKEKARPRPQRKQIVGGI